MAAKKVCIVTNYSSTTNYGALLQAYALNKTINAMGYEAVDLFWNANPEMRKTKLLNQIRHFEMGKLVKELSASIKKRRVKTQLDERKRVMDEFRFSIPHTKAYTKGIYEGLNAEYDVFICGSDQIFRPSRFTGLLDETYWLKMVTGDALKASYAASIGLQSFPDELLEEVKENLSSFNYISMREEEAAKYISSLTGREDVSWVVDPVFLVHRKSWMDIMEPYPVLSEPGDDDRIKVDSASTCIDDAYILVYMIHGTEKLLDSITKFANEKGLKIVTFPSMAYAYKKYEENFGDIKVTNAGPKQFLWLINNAAYIFTDSFHGSALSMILHKSAFISRANEIAFSRIENIVKMTGLEKLVIPADGLDVSEYDRNYSIDWEAVDAAIEKERIRSIGYLQMCIE